MVSNAFRDAVCNETTEDLTKAIGADVDARPLVVLSLGVPNGVT